MKSTQVLIKEGICRDSILRQNFVKNIMIYNQKNLSIIPIKNIDTLEFFAKMQHALDTRDKSAVCHLVQKFMENDSGIFTREYGTAKDHLEQILSSSKYKISNHDLLQHLGLPSDQILNYGISINNKKTPLSTAFEIISAEALKRKYPYIVKIIHCGDGKIKMACYNGTGQKNHDFIIMIEDSNGNKIPLAFDHKVKDFENCIRDLQLNGFRYQVYTLGSKDDEMFYENEIVKSQLTKFDFGKIFDSQKPVMQNISASEVGNLLATDVPQIDNQLASQTISNITDWVKTKDSTLLLRSALMPVLLANNKDISKTILALQTQRGLNKTDVDIVTDIIKDKL